MEKEHKRHKAEHKKHMKSCAFCVPSQRCCGLSERGQWCRYTASQTTTLEEAVVPGSQLHVQSGSLHLIPVPVIGCARKGVTQAPGSPSYVCPGCLYATLNGAVAEIDYNEISIVILQPAPRHQVLKARIVGPARTLAETPLTIMKCGPVDDFQERGVEGL